jgi:hypothetical protein
MILHRLVIALLCLSFAFYTISCGFDSVTYLDAYADNLNSFDSTITDKKRSETMERSNYDSVRRILSASEFIDDRIDSFNSFVPIPFSSFIKVATKVVKLGLYAEDWRHTDKEVQRRINDVLNSSKLENATENPELYTKFEKYVNTSLKNWIPDRDYPKIGYLPKQLLYDQSLGEKEITKYWPEATKEEQDEYVALTFDELVHNYELVWNDLQS